MIGAREGAHVVLARAPEQALTLAPLSMTTLFVDSPLGALRLSALGGALVRVEFGAAREASGRPSSAEDASLLDEAAAQLADYFAGARRAFALPLAPEGSAFKRRVWDELVRIPYGETRSYGALARALGDAALTRAVGAANGANPLPIVVPCHRVVGATGGLVGYAGGLDRKRFLLELESSQATLF
jgi:methylated-DNA-[protein]-cysteine S-methyltransferase